MPSSSSSMSSSSPLVLMLAVVLCSSLLPLAVAKEQYHEFVVQEASVSRLCRNRSIMTVNGQFPGPAVEISEGDSLIVRVINRGRYNVTVHWHGVRQMRTGWSDGPEYVTQCPIRPGQSYTYRFTVAGQEGTLWWHAHSSWLRATVHGALIIRPRAGVSAYPFFKPPAREIPILLGEWWDMNPIDVVRTATRTGAAPNISDALTVNGQPGDLYRCSSSDTATFPVKSGETNLLRFINAALNTELFVSLAGHTMTVVAADASYTKPYSTSVLMIAPGQTTDVLVTFDQPPGRYYLAARAYASAQGVPFDNTTTTAIFNYGDGGSGSNTTPAMPTLPAYNDTATVTTFTTSLRSLRKAELPSQVDESLFFTVGVGLFNCSAGQSCGGPNNTRFTASINNVSFVLPSTVSILQAHYTNQQGSVFTADFPANPPVQFDYTAQNVSRALWQPVPGTKLYKLKYGASLQVVLQGTNIFAGENHPIHIHGYDFYILAEGFGNFDAAADTAKFNLDDPPMRNTVAVPVNGWAVIRFVADNPGVWLMHCHLDVHITWGLAMAFLVEDGVGELQSLQAPPPDLPLC
ncbi:unnamed protein product [Urochloa humidicola]